MKTKEIIEAAEMFSGRVFFGTDSDILSAEDGFMAGASWRIESVWHWTANELPDVGRHVVNEDWFDFTAEDEKDLKRIMKKYPFKRWAYVEDLLPEM